ncbi:DUF6675 family protein [uncultured Treponema sp.]|uniref:DUF6675 family protein n=1 Tax=uncultured Treponema sp. TaxID=162155 RepID=UPI0015AEE743|nr:DUF6675 family protein [uncultured Treponema sp.]
MAENLKKKILLVAVCLFSGLEIFAFSARDIVDSSIYDKLVSDGKIQVNHFKEKTYELKLLPKTELSKKISSVWPSEFGIPVIYVENLYLIPKKNLNSSNPQSVNIEKASRVIRSVSKMDKMPYIDEGVEKILYKEAYCIAGPKDRTRVADPVDGDIDGKKAYVLLNDKSLGKINYVLNYFGKEQEIAADFANCSDVYVGPIKCVETEQLRINLVVVDCEEDLMVYMLVQTKVPAISFLENKFYDTFSKRLDAIYRWFLKQF